MSKNISIEVLADEYFIDRVPEDLGIKQIYIQSENPFANVANPIVEVNPKTTHFGMVTEGNYNVTAYDKDYLKTLTLVLAGSIPFGDIILEQLNCEGGFEGIDWINGRPVLERTLLILVPALIDPPLSGFQIEDSKIFYPIVSRD